MLSMMSPLSTIRLGHTSSLYREINTLQLLVSMKIELMIFCVVTQYFPIVPLLKTPFRGTEVSFYYNYHLTI